MCGRVCHRPVNRSELNHGKTENQSKVADIQSCDGIAKMQCRGANQKIFESNAYAAGCLLALYFPSDSGDFECYGMDRQVATQLFGEGSSAFAAGIALGSVNAVSQFYNSDR